MSQAVVIKSNKHGFNLILDPAMPFEELLTAIEEKFEESAKFFGSAKLAISFDGRRLSQDEEIKIINVITAHTKIEIICIVDDDYQHIDRTKQQVDDYINTMMGKEGDIYRGTLREGQRIEGEAAITIVGDVMPGATIVAGGNIVVMGGLYGTAVAGAYGNKRCTICALEMEPEKLQIFDVIANYSNKKASRPKKSLLKKEKVPVAAEMQMASVTKDSIFISPVPKNVLMFLD